MVRCFAFWCLCLATAACTSSGAPAPDAACTPLPNVVSISAHALVLHEGLKTTRFPLPAEDREAWRAVRNVESTWTLREACSGESDILVPDPDTPLHTALTAMKGLLRSCGGTVRAPLVEGGAPVPVRTQQWCVPERPDVLPPACSEIRMTEAEGKLHLTRYPRKDWQFVVGDPSLPDPLNYTFEGPHRAHDGVQVLREPHEGLDNCGTIGLDIEGSPRWEDARAIASVLHAGLGMPVGITYDSYMED